MLRIIGRQSSIVKHSYLFVFCALLLFSVELKAQYKLSADPAQFVTDVGTMLAVVKVPAVQQVATDFSATWTSFDANQQKKVIDISQKMLKSKKFRPNPHFSDWFAMLNATKIKGLAPTQLDSLLIVTEKSVEKGNAKQTSSFFVSMRLFLESGFVYKSKFNSLLAEGGTFSFRYVPVAADAPLPDALPADTAAKTNNNTFSDWDNPQKAADEWSTIPSTDTSTVVPENIYDVGYSAAPQPTIEGPVIDFININLVIHTPYDSSARIQGTSGTIMLNSNIFVGKGGKMDWSLAGLAPEEAYCTFGDYNFNARSPRITVEGATLNYDNKIEKPVKGIFEYDSKRHSSKEDIHYPRFKSYTSNVSLKGMGENITYKGGFSLGGKHMYSSSVDEGYATIEIKHSGEPRIKSVSNRFELGDSLVTADVSNIILYMGSGDSIYHPGTIFKFNKNSEKLKLYKQPGFKQAPFIDTYHRIEIVADALTWNLNEPKIDFGIINARGQVPATFESEEYFSGDKYAMMKGLYQFHPLQMIVGYSERKHTIAFNVNDLAADVKIPANTLRGAMVSLMKGGFIDYSFKSGDIRIRPKGTHYVLSKRDKKDYDNINFVSIAPGGDNATLDLKTHELTVRGVDKIYISDSLRVEFIPEGKELKILKNRDFKFNGNIKTKNFEFIGKEFQFNYDSFLVHLPTINSIKLMVQSPKNGKDSTGNKDGKVSNELSYSSGVLYINKPNNKSARKRFNQYPIFDAKTGASVMFNKSNIAQGSYDSTVMFKIPPFKIDSLSSNDPNAIGFEGEFMSGGIFPNFKEKLVVMPDHSMGFEHKVPKDGYPLYEGKARYYDKITLNSQGLRGDGEIHFLTTTLRSKDFFFLKDSVLTVGTKAETKEGTHPDTEPGVSFPDMLVEDYKMKWLPKFDSMYISNTKNPILLYKGTASLQGTANITKKGMRGDGILLTRGAEVESPDYKFEHTRFTARNSNFQIKSDNPTKPALLSKGVKFDFDLDKAVALFSPEVEGAASNEFPYAMYKSSMNNGVWDLHKKSITMKMSEGADINKSYFYSTRLDQDSLVFNATEAVYDITKLSLNITGIPFIRVADAKIYPSENKVSISENAVIRTLEKAKITLDTANEYHLLSDGKIDIKSRSKFEGSATYRYVAVGNGKDTMSVKFQEFATFVEEGRRNKADLVHTQATGMIREEDNFRIGPKIFYKGKVTMYAHKKFLSLDGFIKLDLKGSLQNSHWLRYTNTGDSSAITIDLKNATADDGSAISSGMHIDAATNELYTTFISSKHTSNDGDIFSSSGFLSYNAERNEFSIASKEKISDNTAKGSLISYNDVTSSVGYITRFNFTKSTKGFDLLSAGVGTGNAHEHQYHFNALMSFNLTMSGSIYAAMGKNIQQILQLAEDTSSQESIEERDRYMGYKIGEIAGAKAWEKYKMNKVLNNVSLAKLSSDFTQGIVFSEVKMKWSPEHKSFHSVGPLFLSNIQKNEIAKSIRGFIEIQKKTEGDIIHLYIEPIEGAWYYFVYENNRLALVSSNEDLNTVIKNKSDGEKSDRMKYFVTKAEPTERYQFLSNYYKKYFGKAFSEEAPIPEETQATEDPGVEEKPKEERRKRSKSDEITSEEKSQEPTTTDALSSETDVDVSKLSKKEKKKRDKDKAQLVEESSKPEETTVTEEAKSEEKQEAKSEEIQLDLPKEQPVVETPKQEVQTSESVPVETVAPAAEAPKKSKKEKKKKAAQVVAPEEAPAEMPKPEETQVETPKEEPVSDIPKPEQTAESPSPSLESTEAPKEEKKSKKEKKKKEVQVEAPIEAPAEMPKPEETKVETPKEEPVSDIPKPEQTAESASPSLESTEAPKEEKKSKKEKKKKEAPVEVPIEAPAEMPKPEQTKVETPKEEAESDIPKPESTTPSESLEAFEVAAEPEPAATTEPEKDAKKSKKAKKKKGQEPTTEEAPSEEKKPE